MTYNVAFAGSPAFTVPTLAFLHDTKDIEIPFVLTQPDKPVGRKKTITESPVATYAKEHGIPVIKSNSLDEVREEISSYECDALVVIAFGVLFPEWLLQFPPKGCVNIHFSLLPEFRGASPIQSALLEGRLETGITLFKLVKKMDAGDIINQRAIHIAPDDTYGMLLERLLNETNALLLESLLSYFDDRITPQSQNEEQATYCYTIKKEDGRIHWETAKAQDIYNKYRAFNEWPGIWTTWNDEIIKLNMIARTNNAEGTPGRIIMEGNKLFIGTLTEDIEILTLQKAGKSPTTAEEFMRGYLPQISKNPFLV